MAGLDPAIHVLANDVITGQKRQARLRARCPGDPRLTSFLRRRRRGWPGHLARRRAEPVIGPRFARTRWRSCPAMTSLESSLVMKSVGRGVLDSPQQPVIGLAAGETRWRGMTVVGWVEIRVPSLRGPCGPPDDCEPWLFEI